MTDNSGVINAPNITTTVKRSPSSTLDQPQQQQQESTLLISGLKGAPEKLTPEVVRTLINQSAQQRRQSFKDHIVDMLCPSQDIAIFKMDTPEAAAKAHEELDGKRIYGQVINSVILPARVVLLKQEVGAVAIDQFLAEQGHNQPTIQAPEPDTTLKANNKPQEDGWGSTNADVKDSIKQKDDNSQQTETDSWGHEDSGWEKDAKKSANKKATKPVEGHVTANNQQQEADPWGRQAQGWGTSDIWTKKPAASGQGGRGGGQEGRGGSYGARGNTQSNNFDRRPFNNDNKQHTGIGFAEQGRNQPIMKTPDTNTTLKANKPQEDGRGSTNADAKDSTQKKGDNSQQADPWGSQEDNWEQDDSWGGKKSANKNATKPEGQSTDNTQPQEADPWGRQAQDWGAGDSWSRKPAAGGQGERGGSYGVRARRNSQSQSNNFDRRSFNNDNNQHGGGYGNRRGDFVGGNRGGGVGRGGGDFAGRGSRGGAYAFPSGGKTREKNDETDGSDAVEEQNGWGQPPKQLSNNLSQNRESKSSQNGSQHDSNEDYQYQPSKVVSINDIPLEASKEKVIELLLTTSEKLLEMYVGRSLKPQSTYQYALAEFSTIEEATKVVESLKEVEFMGKKLTVNYAKKSTISQSFNTQIREAKFRNRYGDRQQYEQEQASPTSTVSSSPNRDQKEEKNIEEKNTNVQENVDNFAAPIVESTLDNFAAPVVESAITLDNFAAPIVESNLQKVAEGVQYVAIQFNGGEEQVKKEEEHKKEGKDKQEEGSKSKSPNLKDDPIDNFCPSNHLADGADQNAVYEDDNEEDGWKENQEALEGENVPPVY